jgi:hypothetical protein
LTTIIADMTEASVNDPSKAEGLLEDSSASFDNVKLSASLDNLTFFNVNSPVNLEFLAFADKNGQ